jgi:hypothetical protein
MRWCGRLAHDRAVLGIAHVDGRDVVARRQRPALALDDAPDLGSSPTAVDVVQRLLVGRLEVSSAPSAGVEQAAGAAHLVVQADADGADGAFGLADAQILDHRGIDRFRRQPLAVPVLHRLHGPGQVVRDRLVLHAAPQHVTDRHDEGDDDEGEQRQDQQEGGDAPPAIGPPEAGLEGHAVGGDQLAGNSAGHFCLCHVPPRSRFSCKSCETGGGFTPPPGRSGV